MFSFLGSLLVTNHTSGGATPNVIPQTPLSGLTSAKPAAVGNKELVEIVPLLISAVLSIIGILLLVLIIYGGFIWMKAGGNEKDVEKAQAIIKNAVIGLVIVLVAYALSSFILNALIKATT